jgi:uncharacterized membrane protein YhaH (DUF805 family)
MSRLFYFVLDFQETGSVKKRLHNITISKIHFLLFVLIAIYSTNTDISVRKLTIEQYEPN